MPKVVATKSFPVGVGDAIVSPGVPTEVAPEWLENEAFKQMIEDGTLKMVEEGEEGSEEAPPEARDAGGAQPRGAQPGGVGGTQERSGAPSSGPGVKPAPTQQSLGTQPTPPASPTSGTAPRPKSSPEKG